MKASDVVLGILSVAFVGLLMYGKFKLATNTSNAWYILLLGGVVFVFSNAGKLDATTTKDKNHNVQTM